MSNFHNEHVMAWYRHQLVFAIAEKMISDLHLQASLEIWREQYQLNGTRKAHEIYPCPPEYE